MTFRLPPQARVRARAEFDRVFKDGQRTAAPLLALHWHKDAQAARLGLAVSRKVDRRAVGRNRIKRALRETFRHVRPQLASGAYVLVARPAAADSDNRALKAAFLDALRRAGALPLPATDGTMPGVSPTPPPLPDRSGA
jgi:ribonuclease P protein component